MFNQIAAITIVNLADPGTGHPDAYAKAYILFVLPHGLLAMSIATTFEPEMARNVKRKLRQGMIDVTSLGIRLVALLTFPAGMLMFTLRRPIVGVALQHGNFTAANALRHVARARRVRDRARRLLRLPVHAAGASTRTPTRARRSSSTSSRT